MDLYREVLSLDTGEDHDYHDEWCRLQAIASPTTSTVYEHGFVTLEKVMGDDLDIVNNARVSFNVSSQEMTEKEKGLLNFLMRDRHGSPWEAVVFRFHVRAPIFVNREWFRHRIGSFNEESLRYSLANEQYYVPKAEDVRRQTGKPGAYTFETIEDPAVVNRTLELFEHTQKDALNAYHEMLDMGVARELARDVLPVGMFSSFVWTVNLRALFNFLSLRNDTHALREIRTYAEAVEELAAKACPTAFELFNTHGRVTP